MLLLLTIFLIIVLLLVAITLYKVWRVHLMLYSLEQKTSVCLDNHFAQLEALFALYYELRPTNGFQATRGWAASPDFLLSVARRARTATSILECSSGVSTIVLARAIELNGTGHVYSLEHDLTYAEKTRNELKRQNLERFATVIHAPLVSHALGNENWLWYDISKLPDQLIDLLVIDGPPMETQRQARYPALPILIRRLANNASIFLDDASRPDEQIIVKRWIEELPLSQVEGYFAEKGMAVLLTKHE